MIQDNTEKIIDRDFESSRNNSAISQPVQEIISNKPSFLVRYGIAFFIIILCLIGCITWFIKYPDIVSANAKLTSINPPKTIIANSTGKILKLFAKENDTVSQNQILGYLEATANHEQVLQLSARLGAMQTLLDKNNPELIENQFSDKYTSLGELQDNYQIFSAAFLTFKNYLRNGFYLHKKNMLATDMVNLKKMHDNLLVQKGYYEQDISLAEKNFAASRKLSDGKVIADVEFRNENSKLIGKQLTLPQVIANIINNEAQQNEKSKEIFELENTISQQKIIFQQALNSFKSQVELWEKKYLLIAPVSGRISFAIFVQENQQVETNQIICFVNPPNSEYYAQLFIPQSNLGKVQIGQKVLLKFPSYPFAEYGAIEGKIAFISHIPTDSGYLAKISLNHGLSTNYDQPIQYREGLIAQGEIITKDMRLLQRFYYGIIKDVK